MRKPMNARARLVCFGATVALASPTVALAQDDGRYPTPEQAPAFREPTFVAKPLDRAYPGTEYNTRPAVTGGTWPYRFALRNAPDGMRIDAKTGTIAWQAPAAEGLVAQVAVALTDQAGRNAEQTFTITVGKQGFVFVSPDGDDANPGTFEAPWKTVMRATEPVDDASNTTVYLRGGTYWVETPPSGKNPNARNVLAILRTSPRRWMAWPGEQPVIDLGWSEAQWKTALAAEQAEVDAKRKSVATTQGYGHRIHIDHQTDGLLFDGLEIKNAAYYMFVMWDGNRSSLTWRRCHLHHLYGDYSENSSFIFGFAADRKYEKAAPGEDLPFGRRPVVKPYRHLVVQDCVLSDRLYSDPREGAWHGGGLVWYTTQGCLVEDCRFERIARGMAILDKDNGWDNTYRNNLIRGNVMVAAQGCNDGLNIHHNWIDGDLHLGAQPGWLRNLWLHHNAIRGKVSLMAGATRGPGGTLDPAGRTLAGPADPESLAAIRDNPREQRVIFAWGNVIDVPAQKPGGEKPYLSRVPADAGFANGHRHVWWDGNLVDEAAELAIGWTSKRVKWSDLRNCFDMTGARGAVELDDEGRLPADSPWRRTYGRNATDKP